MTLNSGGQSTLMNLVFGRWWYWDAESVTNLLRQHHLLSGPCYKEEKELKM